MTEEKAIQHLQAISDNRAAITEDKFFSVMISVDSVHHLLEEQQALALAVSAV